MPATLAPPPRLWEALFPLRGARLLQRHQLYTGLENWFGLEEAAGLTLASKVPTAASWPLTLSTTGWTWGGGPLGGALTSDAAGTTTARWDASGAAALGTSDMSLAGWAYLGSTSLHGAFWKTGTSGEGVSLGVGSGDMDTAGNTLLGLYEGLRWLNTGVTLGTGWHHYALVVDASGFPHIYLDGVQVYTDTTGAPSGAGGDRTLGYSLAASTRALAGTFGPFGFWRSRALGAADIALLAQQPEALYERPRFWTLSPPLVAVQTAVPISDISAGSWTASTGTALYAMLDETPASDSDYDQSATPRPSSDVMEVRVTSLTDPASSSGHVVRYRARKPS